MVFARSNSYTLWDAAYLTKHKSFIQWYRGLQQKMFTPERPSYKRKSVKPTTINHVHSGHRGEDTSRKKKLPNVMTTFIVGIHPTRQQKRILDIMLRTSNYTYNWCKWLVTKKGVPKNALQNIVCQNQENILPHLRQANDGWFFQQGLRSIKASICEEFESSKYNSTHKPKDKDTSFRPYTGSFKLNRESLIPVSQLKSHYANFNVDTMGKDQYQHVCLLPEFSNDGTLDKPLLLRLSKPIYRIPPFNHNVMVVKEAGNKYRLHIKCDSSYTRKAPSKQKKAAICGIDPGGSTFATVYDPTNQKCFQVGFDKKRYLCHRLKKYDTIMVLFHQATIKGHEEEIENRRRQLLKVKSKIHFGVTDLHVRFASMLVCNYALVSLGKVHVSPPIRKGLLYMPIKKNRALYLWSHDRFCVLLKHRSLGEKCKVIVQDEMWTSKTCGKCGKRNHKLGKNDVFRCDRCNYQTNRDVNGARNILRKTLGIFF